MKKTLNHIESRSKIVCNLHPGEHFIRIKGIDYFRSAPEYIVKAEYPHHYLIGIRYRRGLVPDERNYLFTSISKASIYCGDAVLIKENGEKVIANQKDI